MELKPIGYIEDGRPVIKAEMTIPWSKLSTPCQCGSVRFRMFRFDGVYSRACNACGLISHYLEDVLINPQAGHLANDEISRLVHASAVTHCTDK